MASTSKPSLSFFKKESLVAVLMQAHDWSACALGKPATWPHTLKTAVGLMLHASTPAFLVWGSKLCLLYNDAYLDILGRKHPAALGCPVPEVWPEAWADLEALFQKIQAGESVHVENAPLTLCRKGKEAPAWFNLTYAPVHDLQGKVAGVYCALTETTAQVLAERQRQEEIRRLYSLFEQAPSFMAVVREPGHIYELANQAYLRMVGESELVGHPVCDLSQEMPGQDYLKLLEQVYTTGQPFVGARMPLTRMRQGDEPPIERFMDLVFQPIKNEGGAVTGVFIVGNDVTEHARTEDALRQSRRHALETAQSLNALLEAAPVGIILTDTQGKLLRVNSAHRQLWGTPMIFAQLGEYGRWKGWWADGSDKQGQPLAPHDWALARALQGQEAPRGTVEIEVAGQPGVRRTILDCAAPVRDLEGQIIGAAVAQMDITDRIHTESALRESEAKFRTITDAMPQLVWSTLPDGHHDYRNQQWHEYTGIGQGDMDADAWNGLLYGEDRHVAIERWRHSMETGEPYEIEYRLRHHSGQYRWVLARALPVRDDKGAVMRWMGTCTDIHEQKLAQQALEQSDRRKDEFLAMLAHELRNPLAPITTAANLLSMGELPQERVRQLSEVISRQAGHMTRLIADLMDVSRVTRGLVSLDKKPVDPNTIVMEAVEQVRPLIEAKAQALQIQTLAQAAWVSGDKMRLVQVLANVLSNAVKYTPNGGHIALQVTADDSQVTLSVRDDGIGMSPDLVEHAFELFTQAERTSDRSQGGLGIGLALVKSLVQLHGGTVWAHSEGLGRGSEFTMVLPRLTQQATGGAGDDAQSAHPGSGSLRILVVDDNVDAAQLLGMFVQMLGHQVFVEYAPAKALERAAQALPQVCLLDIGLPDMDGYELARQLRLIPGMEETILAAVTGYGQPQDRQAAFKAGFNCHFSKPIDTKRLAAWLTEMAPQVPGPAASTA